MIHYLNEMDKKSYHFLLEKNLTQTGKVRLSAFVPCPKLYNHWNMLWGSRIDQKAVASNVMYLD